MNFSQLQKEKQTKPSLYHFYIPSSYCYAINCSFLSQADFLKKTPMSSDSAFLISNLSWTYSRLDALSHTLLPTLCPNHSSTSSDKVNKDFLSSNTGHCLDLILKHNSAVFLNATNRFQFLAALLPLACIAATLLFPFLFLLSLLCGLIVYWYSAIRFKACQGLGVFCFLIHAIFLGNSIQDH